MGVAVGIVGFISIETDTQQYSPHSDHSVDWPGAFTVTAGLVLLSFALNEAPTAGWGSPLIISLLIVGVGLIVLFLAWEHYVTISRRSTPLMSLDIWTRDNGRFGAMQAVAFLEWASFSTLTFWAVLYYQNYVRLDPIHTMVRFLPMMMTGVVCNFVAALTVGTINGAYLLGVSPLFNYNTQITRIKQLLGRARPL